MNRSDLPESDEDDIARLLHAVGPREQMPDELRQSWEQVFRTELAEAGRRKQRRRWQALGVAATIMLTLALGFVALRQQVPIGPGMRVVAVSGNSEIASRAPTAGDELLAGSVVATGSDGRVALAWGSYDLRIDANTTAVLGSEGVELRQGRIYVSDERGAISQYPLKVSTPLGEIRDIGTQFTVAVSGDHTEAVVRRGAIVVDTGSGEVQTAARAGAATRVTVNARRQVTTAEAAINGENWNWIYAVTPPYRIDGTSAFEFLQWSAQESGLQLDFASAQAEYYARSTTLHGSFTVDNPEQAVDTVLASTDLVAERKGGALRLSFRDQQSE